MDTVQAVLDFGAFQVQVQVKNLYKI